jgi:hypothetical protein
MKISEAAAKAIQPCFKDDPEVNVSGAQTISVKVELFSCEGSWNSLGALLIEQLCYLLIGDRFQLIFLAINFSQLHVDAPEGRSCIRQQETKFVFELSIAQ